MKLLKYQEEDVSSALKLFSRENNNSVYLGHEPGLGKTVMAVEIAKRLKANSILVICPSSVKGVWDQAIQEQLGYPPTLIHKQSDSINGKRFVVVSYDLSFFPLIINQLLRPPLGIWDALIVDEAHHLGRYGSKRSRAILGDIVPRARFKIFASGSVSRNKIDQLWPVFHSICPNLIGSYWQFVGKYCHVKEVQWNVRNKDGNLRVQKAKRIMGAKDNESIARLSKLIKEKFFIRRLKKSVLLQLPDKLEQRVSVQVENNRQSQAAKDFSEEAAEAVESERPLSENLSSCYRELGMKKLPHIVEYVTDLLYELNPDYRDDVYVDNPLVLFCWHKDVYEQLKTRLAKLRVVGFSSDSSAKERTQAVEDFQKGRGNIFLCTYAAAEGITLTRASYLIRAELPWSRSIAEQSVDRIHRIGQEKQVYIKDIIASDTLDEVVYKTLKQKIREHRKMFS